MEDDITVPPRARVARRRPRTGARTGRTPRWALRDRGFGSRTAPPTARKGDRQDEDDNDEDDENDSASKGEEEPRDFNQKMRSLEDRGKNDAGLLHGCLAFLCGGGGANTPPRWDLTTSRGRAEPARRLRCRQVARPWELRIRARVHPARHPVQSHCGAPQTEGGQVHREQREPASRAHPRRGGHDKLAASGRHPNLPTVYDLYEKRHKGVALGTTVHVVNIVTEQYAGGDLLEGTLKEAVHGFDFEAIATYLGATSFLHNVGRSPRHKARSC